MWPSGAKRRSRRSSPPTRLPAITTTCRATSPPSNTPSTPGTRGKFSFRDRTSPGSHNRHRAHRRAGGPAHFEGEAGKGELVVLVARQVFQEQVFENVDAVARQQDQVAGQCDVKVGINDARHVPGNVIGPNGAHVLLREPVRAVGGDAGSGEIGFGLL